MVHHFHEFPWKKTFSTTHPLKPVFFRGKEIPRFLAFETQYRIFSFHCKPTSVSSLYYNQIRTHTYTPIRIDVLWKEISKAVVVIRMGLSLCVCGVSECALRLNCRFSPLNFGKLNLTCVCQGCQEEFFSYTKMKIPKMEQKLM